MIAVQQQFYQARNGMVEARQRRYIRPDPARLLQHKP
jgi:hypothetical protein